MGKFRRFVFFSLGITCSIFLNVLLRKVLKAFDYGNQYIFDGYSGSKRIVMPSFSGMADSFKFVKSSQLFSSRNFIKEISCKALVRGDRTEMERAANLTVKETRVFYSGEDYVNMTRDCDKFKISRAYINDSLTSLERDFPLAYSIVMYKDIEQSERLLRAIYRPQNFYCIHVDKKAATPVRQGMEGIANCFDNVFLVQDPVDVQWGTFTILEPDLMCMRDLWRYKTWKYFINLTGQEFPLKTNLELVKILMAYNGANNLEGTRKRANTERWQNAEPPPHGIIPTKGNLHVTVSRGFVDYLLHNKTAWDLLEWVKKTEVPDETYFATLNYNPHLQVPGSYKGKPETDKVGNPFLARLVTWQSGLFNEPCHGKYVRAVCVFGHGDLPRLTTAKELFANKFYMDYQRFTLGCLEEWLFNRTREEFFQTTDFDASYYSSLDFVQSAWV